MSFFINREKIGQISGPISFYLLTPTEVFHKDFWDDAPVLLFIGDNHKGTDMRCNESEDFINELFTSKGERILQLIGKSFYQALDSIATTVRPIDYYCEAFFPFKLLQKDQYLALDKNVFVGMQEAVMNYLPRKYLACFSKNQKAKLDICFTKNIRYHLVDVRFAHSNFDLHPEDKLTNQQMSFESEIITNLHCCALMMSEILPIHKGSSKGAIDILHQACTNPISFATWFYDFNNPVFLERSLILKQTKKLNKGRYFDLENYDKSYNSNSKVAVQMKELFLEYYQYYYDIFMKQNKEVIELVPKVQEAIKDFVDTIVSIQSGKPKYNTYGSNARCGIISLDLVKKHSNTISRFLFYLFLPIMDMYYFFRTLKNWRTEENRGWLSVFNAGDLHVTILRNFLVLKKGYFKSEIFVRTNSRCIHMKDANLQNDIHLEDLRKDYMVKVPEIENSNLSFTSEELSHLF